MSCPFSLNFQLFLGGVALEYCCAHFALCSVWSAHCAGWRTSSPTHFRTEHDSRVQEASVMASGLGQPLVKEQVPWREGAPAGPHHPGAALGAGGSGPEAASALQLGAGGCLAGRTPSWPSSGRSSARSARSWWRSRRLHGRRSSSERLWRPRRPPSRSRSCSCR